MNIADEKNLRKPKRRSKTRKRPNRGTKVDIDMRICQKDPKLPPQNPKTANSKLGDHDVEDAAATTATTPAPLGIMAINVPWFHLGTR